MVAPRYSEQVEKIKQFGAIGSDVAIIPEKNILTCMSAMLMGPDVMTLSMITTVPIHYTIHIANNRFV